MPGVGLAAAAGQEFGEHRTQLGKVAAAGAQQGEEIFDGPEGENVGAGRVEADGVDPVSVGSIEQEVTSDLSQRFGGSRRRLCRGFRRPTWSR